MNIKSHLTLRLNRFFSSFAGLNKSSEKYRLIAWKKFGWHVAAIMGFDILVAWILFFSSWKFQGVRDYVPAGLLFFLTIYINCRYLGRFVVSWKGFFLNVRWGFFICDRCHRLKPSRYLSIDVVENDSRIMCGTCEPEARTMRASMKKMHLSFETLAKQVRESAALAQNPVNRVFSTGVAAVPKKDTPIISVREEKSPRFSLTPDKRIENIIRLPEVKASELVRESA